MESLTLVPCFVCFLVLCLRDDVILIEVLEGFTSRRKLILLLFDLRGGRRNDGGAF